MLSAQRLFKISCLAASMFVAQAAEAVTINSFQFLGGLTVTPGGVGTPATINFLPDFSILSQNGVTAGELVGLEGNIEGDYTFDDPAGATTVALGSPTAPNLFTIDDGSDVFTAEVELIELQGGGGGSIVGAIDFSSSSYAGSNAGLIALNDLILNTPDLTITFQTLGGSGVNLDGLFANGSNGVAAYSAVVTAVSEPAPLALLGLGMLVSAAYIRRRRGSIARCA
jgi:hypothetical protein